MDPNKGMISGTCWTDQFRRFQQMNCTGPTRHGLTRISYPYGVNMVKERPYGSSSVGRQPPEPWRYGSGYTGPNPGQVYGEPDYKYYGHEYCGPAGYGEPGYMGDAYGKNPNIRYVPIEREGILGEGMTSEHQPNPQDSEEMPEGPEATKSTQTMTDPPLKFQIRIGDPKSPDKKPQPLKSGEGDQSPEGQQLPPPPRRLSAFNDPCGNCCACKLQSTSAPVLLKDSPSLVRCPPIIISRQKILQCQRSQGSKGQQRKMCAPKPRTCSKK